MRKKTRTNLIQQYTRTKERKERKKEKTEEETEKKGVRGARVRRVRMVRGQHLRKGDSERQSGRRGAHSERRRRGQKRRNDARRYVYLMGLLDVCSFLYVWEMSGYVGGGGRLCMLCIVLY